MALPSTRFNFKGGKKEVAEAVGEIGKAIFSQVTMSVEGAVKTVVPSVSDMVAQITEDLSAGPIDRFNEGLEKVDKLVNKMGVDLSMYSKDLNKFLQERTERAKQSEETINQLRTQNIVAQVNKFGEVSILTKTEIEDQKKLLREQNVEIKDNKKIIENLSKIQQRGGDLNEEQQQKLIDANKKVIETTEKRTKTLETLNITESEDTRTFRQKFGDAIDEYVPDGLRDIGAAFTEGLMAPFTAIQELGMLFGSLLKPLKALPKLLKGFMIGLFGALAAMLPYLLIVGAVVVAIIALKKGFDFLMDNLDVVKDKLGKFADAVMEIPGKIADFFKGVFAKINNFFIDAINGVITLINKIKPGKDIELLEKVADPTSAVVNNVAATEEGQAMRDDSAYIVPKTPDVTEEVEEGGSKFDMFKNFLKQLMPQNTDLIPVMEANAGGATIIDNSVKSVNQNNANQNISLESRNNDSSYHIANRYKDA